MTVMTEIRKRNTTESVLKAFAKSKAVHETAHNEYVCYNCGYTADRDMNAVINLLALIK